jgi:hypothetical protein
MMLGWIVDLLNTYRAIHDADVDDVRHHRRNQRAIQKPEIGDHSKPGRLRAAPWDFAGPAAVSTAAASTIATASVATPVGQEPEFTGARSPAKRSK